MAEVHDSDDHFNTTLDSQSLIAYRLGRVEKAVEANNAQAVERDNNIMGKLETITTLSTQLATTSIRLDNLEGWRKNVTTFLIGLTLSVIGLIGTIVVRSLE